MASNCSLKDLVELRDAAGVFFFEVKTLDDFSSFFLFFGIESRNVEG